MTRHYVVVVDDNPKFVHHVFRHLTQVFEFGFAAPQGNESPIAFAPRSSADDVLTVEWHDPRETASETASDLLRKFEQTLRTRRKGSLVWALIDVYGIGAADKNDWRKYATAFIDEFGEPRLRVVSSYSRHLDPISHKDKVYKLPVHPKSPETLWDLRDRIYRDRQPAPPIPVKGPAPTHLLVTGAGFELSKLDTRGQAIGVPVTDDLLRESGAEHPIPGGYPVPEHRHKNLDLKRAAEKKNLDAYWEHRLRAIAGDFTNQNRPDAEARYLIAEQELDDRESFRSALLRYDVGHLAQALWAAQLDWSFWLSTNYTRFADRAIEFLRPLAREDGPKPWLRITTPMETQLVYSSFVLGKNAPDSRRWLIKLHGDIGQTQSMALAASDKEPLSTFAVRPELERTYGLAAELILQRLERAREQLRGCHWHVVGHGMRDASLLDLIWRVQGRSGATGQVSGPGHVVTIVAPDASKVLADLRTDAQLDLDRRFSNTRFVALNSTAQRYLVQLRHMGLPENDDAHAELLSRAAT